MKKATIKLTEYELKILLNVLTHFTHEVYLDPMNAQAIQEIKDKLEEIFLKL